MRFGLRTWRLAAVCALPALAFPAAVARAGDAPDGAAEAEKQFRTLLLYFKADEKEKRQKAFEGIGDRAKESAEALGKSLDSRRKVYEERLMGYAKADRVAAAAQAVKPDLDAVRKDAVSAIMDKKAYPDADHGKSGQPAVDGKVAAVRRFWETPLSAWMEKDAAFRETLEAMRELDGYYKALSLAPKAGFLDEKNLAAEMTPKLQEALRPAGSAEVLAYNETVKDLVDPEEFENVRHVNDYRAMLGLVPLELDLRLTIAARKHSEEMREKNFFSHDSPSPGRRSFSDRCKLEGFAKPTGENIATGARTGRDAFVMWYHSSGHHRNMIGRHNQMGCGRAKRQAVGPPPDGGGPRGPQRVMALGDLWTQDFGAEAPVRAAASRPKALGYLEQAMRLKPDDAKGHLALATWCQQNGLDAQKVAEAEKVVALEPDNASARWLLGCVKRGNEWVKVEPPPEKGPKKK